MKLPQRSTRNPPKLEFEVYFKFLQNPPTLIPSRVSKTSKFRDQSSLSQLPPETYSNLTTVTSSFLDLFLPSNFFLSFFLIFPQPPSPRTNVLLEINNFHSRLLYSYSRINRWIDTRAITHIKKKKKKKKKDRHVHTESSIDIIIIRMRMRIVKVYSFFFLIEAASRFWILPRPTERGREIE